MLGLFDDPRLRAGHVKGNHASGGRRMKKSTKSFLKRIRLPKLCSRGLPATGERPSIIGTVSCMCVGAGRWQYRGVS